MPTFLERIEAEEEAELERQNQQSPSRPANTTVIPEGVDWHKAAVGAGVSPSANAPAIPSAVIPEGIDWHKKAVGAGVSPSANAPKPKKVTIDLDHPAVEWFAQAQGAPYLYGGTDKKRGIDCSAAMQQAYARVGVKLPRTADEQFHSVMRVEPGQVKPGDMIFFKGTNSKKPGKITHVGIVAANGVMGNAGTGGVEFESYNTPYWRKRIAGFGRPKGHPGETLSEKMVTQGSEILAAGLNLPEAWQKKPAPKKSISVQVTEPPQPPKRFGSWVELATPDLKTERKLAEEERRRVQSLAREEERRLLTNTKLNWDANPLTLAKKLYALRKLNNNMQDTPSNALEAKMRSFDIGALQSLHDSALKAGNTALSSAVKGVIDQTTPSPVFETMQGLDWRTPEFWKTGILEGGILDVSANQIGMQSDTMATAALLTLLGGAVGAATGGVLSKVIPAATAATGVFLSDFKMEDASKYSQVLAEAGAPLHNADALNTWLSDNPEQVEHAKAIAKKRGLAVGKTDAIFTLLGAGVLARAAGKARRLAEAGKAMSRGEKALTAGTVGALEFASEPAGERSGLRAEGKSLSDPESIRAMGEEAIYGLGTSATMTAAQIAASGALATPQIAAKVVKGEPIVPNWPPRAYAARPRITEAKPVEGGFRVTVDDMPIPEVIPVASTKEAINAAREHPIYKLAALTRTVRATPDLGGATVELTDDGALRIRGKGGAEGIVRRATREEAKAAREANQDSAGISARNAGGKTVGAWYKDGVLTMVDGASIDDVSHEVAHWLRDVGLVTDAEYEAIVRWSAKTNPAIGKAIAQLEKQVAQGDPDAARMLQLERDEAFAIAVQNYTAAQLAPASIQSILARIRELWNRLTNVDYRAARGAMQSLYSGQVVNRPVPGAPQTATPAAPAAPAPAPAGGTISPGESEIDRGTMSPPAPEPVVTPPMTPASTPAPEPAPAPAAHPVPREPENETLAKFFKHGYSIVHPQDISFDPDRFQFKGNYDKKTGSTGSLKGVKKWNRDLAGVVLVWRDPANGTVYVVNGHNRVSKALELLAKGDVDASEIIIKEIKAETPEEAMVIGAITNISEGKGSEIDAAKIFRNNTKLSDAELEQMGVDLNGKLARVGRGLAGLNDDLFTMVVNGKMHIDNGEIIGRELAGMPEVQRRMMEQVIKEPKWKRSRDPKRVDNDWLTNMAKVYAAGRTEVVTKSQGRLPGSTSEQGSLPGGGFEELETRAKEMADVLTYTRRKLAEDRNIGAMLSRERTRALLETDKGVQVEREYGQGMADEMKAILALLDESVSRWVPMLTEVADRMHAAQTEEQKQEIRHEAYERIRSGLEADARGVGTDDSAGAGLPRQRAKVGEAPGQHSPEAVPERPEAAPGGGRTADGLDSEAPVVDTLTGDLFGEEPAARPAETPESTPPAETEAPKVGEEPPPTLKDRMAGKEPYEMMRGTYGTVNGVNLDQTPLALKRELAQWKKRRNLPLETISVEAVDAAIRDTERKIALSDAHRASVAQALAEGKILRGAAVLSDYRDLKPSSKTPEAAPTAPEPPDPTKVAENQAKLDAIWKALQEGHEPFWVRLSYGWKQIASPGELEITLNGDVRSWGANGREVLTQEQLDTLAREAGMDIPPAAPQSDTATNARGETVYTHPKTGEEYVISDGISEGRSWGTYTRRPNGSLKRVVSPKVPVRASREEAEADLKRWLGLSAAEPARDAESHTVTPDVTPVTKTPKGKGSVGPKLSKAEREGVWRTLKDVYREHKVQKVEKGQDQHGDPIFGYPHAPEYFVTSDLTGAKLRHYVTLPDGRIAHPSELWPNVTQTEVDKRVAAMAAEVRQREDAERGWLARAVNEADIPEGESWRDAANRKYHATNRKIEGSYFAGDGKGRHVRVDGNSERDVQFWQDQGFTHRESNPVAPEPPEALKPETPDPAADTITPSPEESLELTAQGHEDNDAVQAARRVLEKRRQRQVTEEPPTIHILKPADSGKADAAVTSTSSEWDTQDPRLEALLAKEDDIPLEAAVNAYRWNSMQPEDRGRQARRDYTSHLNFSLLALWDKFTGDDQRAMLEEQWPAIRERFRQNYLTMLGRRGRTASSNVTGPSKFPTARNKKALDAEAAVERKLYDDFNRAHDRLQSQLRKAGSALEDMLTKYFGASMVEHVGMSGTRDYGKERRDALKSAMRTNIKKIGMIHGAEGRNRARAALRAAQDQTGVALFPPSDRIWGDPTEIPGNTKPAATGEELLARFDGATVMVNFDEDRVQIDFKAKPNETLRAALKGAGWHWSPRNGVWQRKFTENAEVSALNILRRFMTKDESAVPGPNTYEGKVRGMRPALNPPATDENPDIRFAGRPEEQGGLFSYDDLEDHPRRTYALIVRYRSADELAKHGLREIGKKNDVQVVTADGEPLTPEVMAEIGAYESALPDASIPKGQRMINVVPPAATWRHEGGGRWSEYSGGKWQPAKAITPAVVQSWVLDTPRNRKAAEIKLGAKMLNPTNPPDYYGGRTLFAVIGEQGAKEAELKNLEVAKEMKAKGLDATTIWLATGWQLGKDGKWRAEVNDKAARLTKLGKQLEGEGTLEQMLDFPALYQRYPQTRKLPVEIWDYRAPGRVIAEVVHHNRLPGSKGVLEGARMLFYEDYRVRPQYMPTGKYTPDSFRMMARLRRSSMLHEVQHIIQLVEGFATSSFSGTGPSLEYVRRPGEVEARLVQARQDMPAIERKATPLSESVDVKDVLFDEGPVLISVIPDDEAPKKTVRAYKLFERGKDGGLYPLKFPDKGKPIPVGVWVEAEVKPKKPGFAHRPGWHAGRLPDAGWLKQRSTGDYDPNRVWAEVELSADVDWQPEADASKSKDIKHDIPRGGMYRFPRPGNQGGEWVIAGTMRINRVLTPDEVQSILADAKGDVRFAARPDDPEPDQKSLFDDVDVVIEEGLKYIGSQNVTRMDWNSFDDGKAVLQGMGELFDDSREAIRRQRRGVQTWDETRALAQAKALGITPKMLARIKPGTAFNAENATALRIVFMSLARKWEQAQAAFAASGSVEDMAARDQALAEWKIARLAAQGAPTEAGRTLQAYRMLAREIQRLGSKKDLLYQRLVELRGPVDEAVMIQIADIPDNDTVALFRILNKAAKAQAKWGDHVHTVLYCNMLSSLNPHGMNFLGNLSHTLLERAAYAGAAGIDKARSAITGKKREIYFVPALRRAARAKAFYDVAGTLGRALDRGINLAKEGFTIEQAERFDIPHGHSLPPIRINGKDYWNPYEWPLRGLGSADEIQRSIAEQISINDSCVTAAINNLKRQGKRFGVDEIAEEAIRVRDKLIEHPKIIEEARKQGDRILLTSPPGDRMLEPFMKMINGEVLNTGLRPLKLVVPFVRVAANATKRGLEWGPIGTLELLNPDLTTKERELVISRAMLGTLAMAGLYTAAMAGAIDIKGEEPEGTGERSLQEASGRRGWSIRIPGTNRWVPLYISGVLSPMLYGVAAAVDATKAGKSDKEIQTAFWGGFRGIYKGVMDQSYMQGLTTVLNALADSGGRWQNYVDSAVGNVMGQFVPMGGLVGQVANATDKVKRDTRRWSDDKSLLGPAVSRVKSRIPGLRQTLPPAVDVLGREQPQNPTGLAAFSKLVGTDERPDPIQDELLRIGWAPGYVGKEFSRDKVTYKLTREQWLDYQKQAGTAAYDGLSRLFDSENYRNAEVADQREMARDVVMRARADVRNQIRREVVGDEPASRKAPKTFEPRPKRQKRTRVEVGS